MLLRRPGTAWDSLAQRQASLRELLSPLNMVYATQSGSGADSVAGTIPVDVGNVLDFPVEIVSLIVGGQEIPADPAWVDSASAGQVYVLPEEESALLLQPLPLEGSFLEYVRLNVPQQALGTVGAPPDMQVVTRVWGLTQTYTQTVVSDYPVPLEEGPLPEFPAVEDVLAAHPYLRLAEGDAEMPMLTLSPGSWDIVGNLVLPAGYGLYLEPGTTLRFGSEAYLLANGPLIFEGTEAAPVVLQPTGEQWWGIAVLQAGARSSWRYVTIENTNAISTPGWTLTGGITFYRSDIRLDHSRILGTLAEDGFNVVRAAFEFVDSEFANTASDAFDTDFGQGLFERCVFHDIGADGIDVSGADLEVRDVRMVNLGDKGLSVGEMSRVRAEALDLENVDFGVVSKDLSQATISNVTIKTARIAGLAAYIKKPSYGPASIVAEGVTFVDIPSDHETLIQTGSWIDLEGTRIWGIDFDVDALYLKWPK